MEMGHSIHVENSAIVAYHSAESEPALPIQIFRSPDSPYDRAWKILWQEMDWKQNNGITQMTFNELRL